MIGVWGPVTRRLQDLAVLLRAWGCRTPLPSTRSRISRRNWVHGGIAYLHVAEAVAGPAARSCGNGARDADPAASVRRAGDRQWRLRPRVGELRRSRPARPTSWRSACPFLANPDLPERWRRGAPLNAPQVDLFYAGEEKGYIDYPTLEAGHGLNASGATPGLSAGGSDTVRMSRGSFPVSTGIGWSASILTGCAATISSGRCRFDPERPWIPRRRPE